MTLGLVAVGGAYLYFKNNPEEVQSLKERAQREGAEAK
jgi:hypothetical protein